MRLMGDVSENTALRKQWFISLHPLVDNNHLPTFHNAAQAMQLHPDLLNFTSAVRASSITHTLES